MRDQRDLITASLAREHGAYEASGPLRRHPSTAERLRVERAENARLRAENVLLREGRAALVAAVTARRAA